MDYELAVLNTIVTDVSGNCCGISNNCIDFYTRMSCSGVFSLHLFLAVA